MKARVAFAHQETNPGKLGQLAALSAEYRAYVQQCVDLMIAKQRPCLARTEFQEFFPPSEVLTSQIKKCARQQAANTVWSWTKSLYANRLQKKIADEKKTRTKDETIQLRTIGRYALTGPRVMKKGVISRQMVDLYWSWVWDEQVTGSRPVIGPGYPMTLSEMCVRFERAEKASAFGWWIEVSTLVSRERVIVPLVLPPTMEALVGGQFLAQTVSISYRHGRWQFQFADKTPTEEPDGSKGKIGVDVGLNVMAATSDGRLYGADIKPKFNRLYHKVQKVRSNRFRQGLKKNSPRLDRLEQRLSGLVKTAAGTVANQLVADYPGYTFVVEDLDLRGCRGQKRFAYRAVHQALGQRAVLDAQNPAYTSQGCPSCLYANRRNRQGTAFHCLGCGRISHADVIGAVNLLGRSEDEQITIETEPSAVKAILGERYAARRSSRPADSSPGRCPPRRVPSARTLTVAADRRTPHSVELGHGMKRHD
jgi:hypothetical protein